MESTTELNTIYGGVVTDKLLTPLDCECAARCVSGLLETAGDYSYYDVFKKIGMRIHYKASSELYLQGIIDE